MLAKAILAGATKDQIARRFPSHTIRLAKGIEAFREWTAPQAPSWRRKRVVVLIGETGTGKTRYANSIAWTFFRQEPYTVDPQYDPL